MIPRRIYVNLGVFFGLFLLLSYWAVTNVVKFDFIEKPYHISADFESSPGLRPGFDVTFLGVRVGSLGKVDLLDKDGVHVDLKIDRGVKLPSQLNAYVRRKSAVGEPAVDLQVIPGADRTDSIEKGTNIPIKDSQGRKRTFTPLSYADLFGALDQLVSKIPEKDLNTLIHELSLGVDGRAPAFRTIVQSATDLTTTLSQNSPLLDSLLADLTHVSQLLLDKNSPLVQSFDNLTLLAESLSNSRADLDAVLERTPLFLSQLSRLLANAGGDIGCLVDSLAVTAPGLAGPKQLQDLRDLLDIAGATGAIVESVSESLPDALSTSQVENYLRGGFILNLGTPAERYSVPEPVIPVRKSCGLSGIPPGPGGNDSTTAGSGTAGSPGAGNGSVLVPDRREPLPEKFDKASEKPATKKTIIDQVKDALPLLLILGLIVAVVLFLLNEYAKRQDAADKAKKAKQHSVSRAAFALVKQGDDPGYLADMDPDVIQAAELAGQPVPPPPSSGTPPPPPPPPQE